MWANLQKTVDLLIFSKKFLTEPSSIFVVGTPVNGYLWI